MTRTILVTGSASGIGKATTSLLRARGDTVIGLDLKNAEIRADLSTAAGRSEGIAQGMALSGGKLDAIIACAGIASADPQAMVAINYFGTLAIIEGLREALLRSDMPRVAVISSSASILPTHLPLVEACLEGDEPSALRAAMGSALLAYASTKCALSRWIRRASILPQWAGSGILINGVAPGTVRTPMTAPMLATAQGRAMLAEATPIVLNEFGVSEDIAPALAFLASPDCRYMVGQVIFMDGGTEVIMRGEAHI